MEASSYLPQGIEKAKTRGRRIKVRKIGEKRILLVTHRCDGAILSDRCGDGLSAVHAQAVCRYIELLTQNEFEKQIRGKGEKSQKKVDKTHIAVVTHRCDGAILSDRCSDGLCTVQTQAVRRYIELLTRQSEQRKQGMEKRKDHSQKEVEIETTD